jgi:hypothetical protein
MRKLALTGAGAADVFLRIGASGRVDQASSLHILWVNTITDPLSTSGKMSRLGCSVHGVLLEARWP